MNNDQRVPQTVRFAAVLCLTLVVAACSDYRPLSWDEGVSWARARQLANLGVAEARRGSAARARRHLVMPGDTVIGIARRYGIPVKRLIALNGLEPPYRIYVGQVLRLEGEVRRPRGRYHVVARGETLSHIALRYGLRVSDLVAANPGIEPRRLFVGQRIRLPEGAERSATRRIARLEPREEVKRREARARVREASRITAPPLSGRGFLWPVEGPILARFGKRANGLRNDGINIAAPEGTPVRAAESGVVVYAGDAIPAFGRMLIIRHADGYLTAYAHNATLLVSVGDVVRRGQTIARVGHTGDVATPQLHFQLRRGSRPLDPLAYLGKPAHLAARGS